jgi:hypothetical protein
MQKAPKTPGYVYGFYATGILAAKVLLEYVEHDAAYLRSLFIAVFIGAVSALKLWWTKKHAQQKKGQPKGCPSE